MLVSNGVIAWHVQSAFLPMLQESPDADQVDRNDPNYDSGEEKRALAFHLLKVEQIKAYKQVVSLLSLVLRCCWLGCAHVASAAATSAIHVSTFLVAEL